MSGDHSQCSVYIDQLEKRGEQIFVRGMEPRLHCGRSYLVFGSFLYQASDNIPLQLNHKSFFLTEVRTEVMNYVRSFVCSGKITLICELRTDIKRKQAHGMHAQGGPTLFAAKHRLLHAKASSWEAVRSH